MDEVDIVDVDEDGVPQMDRRTLENKDLSFLQHAAGDILAQYGWHLLFVTVGLFLLIQYLSKRLARQGHSRSHPETFPDPESVVKRQEALEASRRRMQEEFDVKAALFKEKQKQLEEEKRRKKIEIWESMQEGRSYKGTAKLAQATEEATSSTTVLKAKTDKKALRNTGNIAIDMLSFTKVAASPNDIIILGPHHPHSLLDRDSISHPPHSEKKRNEGQKHKDDTEEPNVQTFGH